MANKDSKKERKSLDPTIAAAIITVIGGIITTFIVTRANNPPTVQPTNTAPAPQIVFTDTVAPAVPTDTVPVGADTSTPAPTLTFTPIPPVALGTDWSSGCISSYWMPYPAIETTEENGCLAPPVDQFFIKSGKLAIGFSITVPSAEIHGLFAKLPADGTFTLNMNLNEVGNGEILVGVFSAPDIESKGAMLVVPATNNLDKTKILLKSMPGQKLFSQSSGPVESNAGTYDLLFDFNSGEVTVKLNNGQINLGSVPVLSAEKWIFIGYQVFFGANNLGVEFFDLTIVP